MQTPNLATLRRLAESVNARIAEEYELFGFPPPAIKLSPGIIRAAWEVLAEAIEVEQETESLRADPPPEEFPPARANKTVPPKPAARKPGGGRFSRVPLDELKAKAYAHLRSIAQDGIVPRYSDYDGTRSSVIPTSTHLRKLLGMSWKEIAAELGLTMLSPAERMIRHNAATLAGEKPQPQPRQLPPNAEEEPSKHRSRYSGLSRDELKKRAYALILSLAEDGIMPRQTDYEEARGDALPGRLYLSQLLGMTWNEMAQELGLTPRHPDPAPQPPVAPPPASKLPRTLAEVDAEATAAKEAAPPAPKPAAASYIQQQAFERRKLRVDFFDILRKISIGGVMPTIDEYNLHRPDTLPNAAEVMNRLAYTDWHDIAADVPLATKPRLAGVPRRQRQSA